jgi:hypothetical protein
MSGRWVDLREAAELLGISTEAVRKRATRGSLRSDRHNGRVVVWVDDDRTEGGREAEVDGGPLVEMLTDQMAYLRSQLDQEREANRENRRIIAALTQRIPEIEAPRESPVSSDSPGPTDTAGDHGEGQQTPTSQRERSWWRRLFEG